MTGTGSEALDCPAGNPPDQTVEDEQRPDEHDHDIQHRTAFHWPDDDLFDLILAQKIVGLHLFTKAREPARFRNFVPELLSHVIIG